MAAKTKPAEELAEQYPASKHVKVRVNSAAAGLPPQWSERTVQVDEFEITQIGQIAAIMRKMGADTKLFESDNILSFVLVVASEHGDELIEAVAIALRLPIDDVRHFSASSFVESAVSIYETNRDFFVRSLGNRVSGFMETVTRLMPTMTGGKVDGAGNTQLPSFESTAASPNPNVSH